MKVHIHIYHLDPGKEEERIISMLEDDGVLPKFSIVGDTADTNSIVVYLGSFEDKNIHGKTLEALELISDRTLNWIFEKHLSIYLRLLVDSGLAAFFRANILEIAGKKGIGFYAFNQQNI